MKLYLTPNNVDAFFNAQQDLSRIEFELASFASEPFPEYPGVDAPVTTLRAWAFSHEARTERIMSVVSRRAMALARLRDLLSASP